MYDLDINDLLALVSNSIWHSVPSNSFPAVYPCSDIGNVSSALILLGLVVSTLPKYVVHNSEFSSNLAAVKICDWIPLYISKYSSYNFSGMSPKSNSNICLSSFVLGLLIWFLWCTALIFKL